MRRRPDTYADLRESGSGDQSVPARGVEAKVRDPHIDALRGLAILGVVLHHSILASAMSHVERAGTYLWTQVSVGYPAGAFVPARALASAPLNVIVSVHLALFTVLAGYVTSERSLSARGHVLKRFRRLMVPYVAWLVVISLAVTGFSVRQAARMTLDGFVHPFALGGLWYLYALFLSSTALWVLAKVSTRGWWLIGASVLLALAPVALPRVALFRYLGLAAYLPYLAVGHVTRRGGIELTAAKRPLVWLPALVVFTATLA
ncbi:MAG: acyltransferase, partial [Actinobacteria bacterium]